MAISRIATQDAKGASTTTSASATYPAATTSGNLLICTVFASVLTSNFTTPTGWNIVKLQDLPASANRGTAIYARDADGTETTVTISATGSVNTKIHIYEYTGAQSPYALDGTPNGSTSSGSVTSLLSGSVTTTQ